MSDRITAGDVRSALAHYVDAMERYGITYDGTIGLQVGSKTYGIGWRVYRVPTGETGHWDPPIGSDFLGMTAREAYETLTNRTRVMHDMAQALGLPRHETTLDRVHASLARDVTS